MLHSRNIPLQTINDVRDQAAAEVEAEGPEADYASGVLATLGWLNGDCPEPFELPEPEIPAAPGPVEGTLTTHAVPGDEDDDDEEE